MYLSICSSPASDIDACADSSIVMAGNCSNENHKGILMLPAAGKYFMALLRAFRKSQPETLMGRQGGADEKKNKNEFLSKVICLGAGGCPYTSQGMVSRCCHSCCPLLKQSSGEHYFLRNGIPLRKRGIFKEKNMEEQPLCFSACPTVVSEQW